MQQRLHTILQEITTKKTLELLGEGLRLANVLRDVDSGIKIVSAAAGSKINLDQHQLFRLTRLVPENTAKFRVIIDGVSLERYRQINPQLLGLVVKDQRSSLRNLPLFAKLVDDTAAGVNRSTHVLNVMLEGLAKQGDVKGAEILLSAMEKSGKVSLEHKTYGSLMEAYSRGSNGQRVLELWNSNPHKTPINCQNQIAILLDSCGFNNDLPTLKRQWNLIKQKAYILNPNIYHSYVQALLRLGDLREASSVVNSEMSVLFPKDQFRPTLKLLAIHLQRALSRIKYLQGSTSVQRKR